LQHTATQWNTKQPTTLFCIFMVDNKLRHTATHWSISYLRSSQHTATHCNTLQHHVTRCNTRNTLGSFVFAWWPTDCGTLQHNEQFRIFMVANILRHTETHFNTLPRTAAHCNTLQHNATHCSALQHAATYWAISYFHGGQRTATHNELQHVELFRSCIAAITSSHNSTHCRNTLTHCNTLRHTATHWAISYFHSSQHTEIHCNTLQHAATHCNTLGCFVFS